MADARSDSFEQGLRLIQRLGGQERPAVLDLFESIGEADFGEECVGFIYGTVYHRPGLSVRERQLATVGALTALGYAPSQLQFHAKAALNVGCTPEQVVEAIDRVGAVTGSPALDALAAVGEAFAGREEHDRPAGESAVSRSARQLSSKDREIVAIAACTALGTALRPLRAHINGLLDVGGTRQEVIETLLHLAFYAGFPAALNAIGVAREVFAERAEG